MSSNDSTGKVKIKRTWYRTTRFNAHVIGIVGFTAPGLWNAMNALGAGGAREPYLVNAANALVFALLGVFCLLGATVANYIGLAWTLALGAVGYPLYSAGLYCNVKFGNVWFVLVGAAIDGISAGLFWASEAAVAVGYPEPAKRGKYLNIWVWWRTLGPIVGGAIVLALNNKQGQRPYTYLVFIALQCLSVPVALLLTPPEKVERSDGTKVQAQKKVAFKQNFVDLWKSLKRREILLLFPIFSAAYFNSYSSTFATVYFSVRARALNGLLGNFPVLLASQLISWLLDCKRFTRKRRLVYGFWIALLTHILAWVYALVVIVQFRHDGPVLDWTSKGYAKGFFVDVFCKNWRTTNHSLLLTFCRAAGSFSKQILQSWLYYVMGTLTDDISELTRYTGILRGMESFAQAVAYGLNATRNVDPWVPVCLQRLSTLNVGFTAYNTRKLGINVALLLISIYPTWLVISNLEPPEDEDIKKRVEDEEDTASVSQKAKVLEDI
ncbi:hypothetical protein QCA50_009072 [Cerrena zonata]|uniref:MFS general substrate transporter n=1 Tax=Cerrena zonata TaxID=2478898 RepID=A0AAW0G3E1_9APHY